MSTTTHHTRYDPSSDDVDIREAVDQRDGFFTVSLPLSSDSLARDGEAFDTDRLRGFQQQINGDRTVPVFLSHGRSPLTEERYGALGKVGRVTGADLETRDGTTLLTADLEIADPDELAQEGDTGEVEAALRWVRQQFRLGLGAVSVGWQEETAGRDVPGDAELLEVSVVGIESDTNAEQAAAEPSQAAVRGFDLIPSESPPSQQSMRDMKGWDETTDRDRAKEALTALEQYVDDIRHGGRSRGRIVRQDASHPVVATVEEVINQVRGPTGETLTDRLEDLRADNYETRRRREDLLARLDTIEEHRAEATPTAANAPSADPVADAIETLRELLTDEDNGTDSNERDSNDSAVKWWA